MTHTIVSYTLVCVTYTLYYSIYCIMSTCFFYYFTYIVCFTYKSIRLTFFWMIMFSTTKVHMRPTRGFLSLDCAHAGRTRIKGQSANANCPFMLHTLHIYIICLIGGSTYTLHILRKKFIHFSFCSKL